MSEPNDGMPPGWDLAELGELTEVTSGFRFRDTYKEN
jgi:hypothetical protein